MIGFCRIRILNFRLTVKPLHEDTKGPDSEPLEWSKEVAFGKLKQTLSHATVLGIPYLTKPFTLYVVERKGIANRSPYPRPGAT